jgi:hypothetical protein
MDALFPMMYFQGNHFYPFVVDWKEHSYGRQVAPGLAIYMLHPREKNWDLDVIRREMNVLRQQGLGITFFRSKFFTDNVKDIYTFTQDFNPYPALIPPMDWITAPAPRPVTRLSVNHGAATDLLSWQGAPSKNDGNYLLYNIYASDRYPVDTNRLLVTGISLGGYGTWDLVCRYPGRFAAAIPVCGAGDPLRAEAAAKTPLWIFHGERDGNVPNKMDRAMVGRLWELDAPVRYMEYPDAGHGIWGRVYSDDAVMKWFFQQRRK